VKQINIESNSVESRTGSPERHGSKAVCVLLLLQIVLLLTAVGSVTGQYHVYEEGESGRDAGHYSPGSLTSANFDGERDVFGYDGAGIDPSHPTAQYVTPQLSSYGVPTRQVYYEAGDHSGVGYGGAVGGRYGDPADRVRVQVRFRETQY
jgi:hypothetical protein